LCALGSVWQVLAPHGTEFRKNRVVPWLPPILLAPFIGSFLGVVIRRLPAGKPLVLARSACETCETVLAARDLVPVASYLIRRGRCRVCGARIAPFHLAVELAALAIPASAALVETDPDRLWLGCGLGWTLLCLGWIDADHFRLPDVLTLPLLVAGLGATWWLDPAALTDHAAAAIAGYALLRLLGIAYRRARGREGIGQGDAKLFAAAGAWVGLAGLSTVLLAAALAGLAWAGLAALRGRRVRADMRLPFGPFLAFGLWLAWLGAADFGG
jgi:leader peptidase (prepilin peptidase) / N-methyltransferase